MDDPTLADIISYKMHRRINGINSWVTIHVPTSMKRKYHESAAWAYNQMPGWEIAYCNPEETWLFVNNKYYHAVTGEELKE